MKDKIYNILHDARTEFAIVGLILLSVALLVLQVWTEHNFPNNPNLQILEISGHVLTAIFVVELGLRYWVARNKGRFFRNYWIDIIAVIPTLRAFRALRVLRLLRLFRVGILLNRRLSAISATMTAGLSAQAGILLVIGMIILSGALAMMLADPKHFGDLSDALWWSFSVMVSGEPVSLNDKPATTGGQIITAMVMIGGITMFAVFTGVVSAVMVQRLKLGMEARELSLDELRDHIIICGWNRAGHVLIQELRSSPQLKNTPIVVVIEELTKPLEELKSFDQSQLYLHKGDYTRIDILEEIGVKYANQAVLLADKTLTRSDQDRDARTVLSALTIEKLNPTIHTTAQLLDRHNNVQLQVAGVENVVIDDQVCGHLIATGVRNKGLLGILSELLSVQVGNQLYKVQLPETWTTLTYGEACTRLKQKHDVLLIGLERGDDASRESLVNPTNSMKLQAGDELAIVAPKRPDLEA